MAKSVRASREPAAARRTAAIVLDGSSMTPALLRRIAAGEPVRVAPGVLERVMRAHAALLMSASRGQPIYGLTVGVGQNKDRAMVAAKGQLTPEMIGASSRFNADLIRSHCIGYGPDLDAPTTRAVLATRLNMLLVGGSGVQPKIIEAFVAFLNKDLIPAIPAGGSLGQGDITILGHIGLALMGEGEVYQAGRKIAAAQALQEAGLAPISPFGKDALAIFSSNAYSAALAALALTELAQLARVAKLVFGLSLEALNGNVAPFLAEAIALRPFPGSVRAASALRALLAGSYLWQADAQRQLQDPLSFRTAVHLLGVLDDSQERLHQLLAIQLNASDDNPGIAADPPPRRQRRPAGATPDPEARLGAVLPNANFDPRPWVIAFEEAAIVLAHQGGASAQRIIRLNDPAFTGLQRFLGTEHAAHAFAAAEKPVLALASECRELALPVSIDSSSCQGNIEDVSTNAPRVVQRVRRQIDNGFRLLGIELMHAAQAIDLRRQQQARLALAPATEQLYQALRAQIPLLTEDRPLSGDFARAAELMKHYPD